MATHRLALLSLSLLTNTYVIQNYICHIPGSPHIIHSQSIATYTQAVKWRAPFLINYSFYWLHQYCKDLYSGGWWGNNPPCKVKTAKWHIYHISVGTIFSSTDITHKTAIYMHPCPTSPVDLLEPNVPGLQA